MGTVSGEQLKIYRTWFQFADSDCDGRLTGNEATNFFSLSGLSKPQLKQVWAIADSKRLGFLGLEEFVTALQLIFLAQQGHELTSDLLESQGHLETLAPPCMEGLDALLELKKRGPVSNDNSEGSGNKWVQPSRVKTLFSKFKKNNRPLPPVTSIIDGLKRLYEEKLKPLEATYLFNVFASPFLTSCDFDAKPMVMLLGPHSTGKTTFIEHLLECRYPGSYIGPEPINDRFIVVMSGPDEKSIPGNTIAVHADLPFTGLSTFGGSFLSKFECSQMPHPMLEHITFVDTPGVLSGEKQGMQKSYDFTGVIAWFAARCDLILVMFDPHKLDMGDEFRRIISSLHGHDDKLRVILNKADQVDAQQLMKVYGALMWTLGKVLNTHEIPRVYIGSFNDSLVKEAACRLLGKQFFKKEEDDLCMDLTDMPKNACDRRINEFVKRARAAKVHAYIMSHLKKEMPALTCKAKTQKRTQKRLIDNLESVFEKVQREYHLPAGDFPNVERFKEVLSRYNIDDFERLKPKLIQAVDDMLGYDIPELLTNFRNLY